MKDINNNIALYIHWPFCKSKCPYCDFNSHVASNINTDDWLNAYLSEIDYYANFLKEKKVSSIFFGGGTPSLMNPIIVDQIINKLLKNNLLEDKIEVTLEGNPTSIESKKYTDFRNAGINRVSLGVQSLIDNDLKFLGREHSSAEALKAVDIARNIFDNYSFDLIYARPNQTLQDWENELNEAIKYIGPHLSLYQLTIEKGTPFYSAYNKKKFHLPEEELSVDMYELTSEILKTHGILQYEVSNYSKPGFESKHNLTYWQYGDYIGIGPGAHGRITLNSHKHETISIYEPDKWLKTVNENRNGLRSQTKLSKEEMAKEYIMMGLRLVEGINKKRFEFITGSNLNSFFNNEHKAILIKNKLLKESKSHILATKKGLNLLNNLILYLSKP